MKPFPFDLEQLSGITTPSYLYDAKAITATIAQIKKAFSWVPNFRGYYRVGVNANPTIIDLIGGEGFGLICSSLYELHLSKRLGFKGEQVLFSSCNTPLIDFQKAKELEAIISLDDLDFIDDLLKLGDIPKMVMLRYNPGDGNGAATGPESFTEVKNGLTREQLFSAIKKLQALGVGQLGIESIMFDDSLCASHFIASAQNMFELAVDIKRSYGIELSCINLAGGLDIPYKDNEDPINLKNLSSDLKKSYKLLTEHGLGDVCLSICFGRYLIGPAGYLMARVRTVTNKHKRFVGLDASMAQFLRPALLGSYHQVSVVDSSRADMGKSDIVGSIDRSRDKFAVNRKFPMVEKGDLIAFHDVGAYGYVLSTNYCGRMRPAEYLMTGAGELELIRRAETPDDLLATLRFDDAKTKV